MTVQQYRRTRATVRFSALQATQAVGGLPRHEAIVDSPAWASNIGDNTPPNHITPLVLFSTRIPSHIKCQDTIPAISPHIHAYTLPKHVPTKKNMSLPWYPTEQFPSSHFLVSGGSILFASTHSPLRICLIYHHARQEWLLPKGRKDRGESVPAAAVRETFEETRYPCKST